VLPDVIAAVRVLGGHADASIGISGDAIRFRFRFRFRFRALKG
jgi:hypothetical protein